jgi:hypothetical protein
MPESSDHLIADSTSAKLPDTSKTFSEEFYRSAVYSAVEGPVLGITQLIDQTGSNLSAKVQNAFSAIGVGAPDKVEFNSGAWFGQTIGGAIGMMAPLGLMGAGARRALGGINAGLLSERAAIGLSVGESATMGLAYGTFLTPSDGKNLLTERLTNGATYAASFGLMSGTGLGMSRLATTETAARWNLTGALTNPITSGVLSGIPAGLVNAETEALKQDQWIFDREQAGKNIYSMMIVGGLFGAKTQLIDKAAPPPKTDDAGAQPSNALGTTDGPVDKRSMRTLDNLRAEDELRTKNTPDAPKPNDAVSTEEANTLIKLKGQSPAHAEESTELLSRRGDVAALVAQHLLRTENSKPLKRDEIQDLHTLARDAVAARATFQSSHQQWKSQDTRKDRVTADEARDLQITSKIDPTGTAEMIKELAARGPVSERVGQKLVEGVPPEQYDSRNIKDFEEAIEWLNNRVSAETTAYDVLARARRSLYEPASDRPIAVDEAAALVTFSETNPEAGKELAGIIGTRGPVEKLVADRLLAHQDNPINFLVSYDHLERSDNYFTELQNGLDTLHEYALDISYAQDKLKQVDATAMPGDVPYANIHAYHALRMYLMHDEAAAFTSLIKRQYGARGDYAMDFAHNDGQSPDEYTASLKHSREFLAAADYADTLESAYNEAIRDGSDKKSALAKAFAENPVPDRVASQDRDGFYETDGLEVRYQWNCFTEHISMPELKLLRTLAGHSPERALTMADMLGARSQEARFGARFMATHSFASRRDIAKMVEPVLDRYADALRVAQQLRQNKDNGAPIPPDDLSLAEAKAVLTLHTGRSEFWDIVGAEARDLNDLIKERGPNAQWVLKFLKSRQVFSSDETFEPANLIYINNARVLEQNLDRFAGKKYPQAKEAYTLSRQLGELSSGELNDFVTLSNRLTRTVANPGMAFWSDVLLDMSRDARLKEVADSALPGIYARAGHGHAVLGEYSSSQLEAAAPAWEINPNMPTSLAMRIGRGSVRDRIAGAVAWNEAGSEEQTHARFAGVEGSLTPGQQQLFEARHAELRTKAISSLVNGLTSRTAIRPIVDVLYPNLKHRNQLIGTLEGLDDWVVPIASIKPREFDAAYKHLEAVQKEAQQAKEQREEVGPLVWNRGQQQQEDQIIPSAPAALQLAQTFGGGWREWLAAQSNYGRSLHDATYWLPNRSAHELPGLGQFLRDNSGRTLHRLELAAKRWDEVPEGLRVPNFEDAAQGDQPAEGNQVSEGGRTKLSDEARAAVRAKHFDDVIKQLLSVTYPNALDVRFAEEAASWGVHEHDYPSYEARYLAAKDIPSPFPTDVIWRKGNLIGHFIGRDDPRGVFLGKYTNCCQHPDNRAGAASAWNGLENPNAGYFVIERVDGKNSNGPGEIIAQSWTWISDQNGLVFDNVEALKLGTRDRAVRAIYLEAAKKLSEEFPVVTLGATTGDLNLDGLEDAEDLAQALPKGYTGNSDARDRQVLLAENPQAKRASTEKQ